MFSPLRHPAVQSPPQKSGTKVSALCFLSFCHLIYIKNSGRIENVNVGQGKNALFRSDVLFCLPDDDARFLTGTMRFFRAF
jgi:hypothetical protein